MNITNKDLQILCCKFLTSKNNDKLHDFLRCMLALMAKSHDISSFGTYFVKLCSIPYLPLKKVLCCYLIRYSDHVKNLGVVFTNYVLKDFSDGNPTIRRLALKTVCNLPHLKKLAQEMLKCALQDSNSYVRHSAVNYCPRVIDDSDICSQIINQLYTMMRDSDTIIVSCCIACLNEILKNEGGIVFNDRMVSCVFDKVLSFPEWHLSILRDTIKMFHCKCDIFLTYMNSTLVNFYHTYQQKYLVLYAIDLLLFLFTPENNSELEIEVGMCLNLIVTLNIFSQELIWAFLEIPSLPHFLHVETIKRNFRIFLCQYRDKKYLKMIKIKFLPLLLSSYSENAIIGELYSFCTKSKEFSWQAALSISMISQCLTENKIIPVLITLENRYLVDHMIACARFREFQSMRKQTIKYFPSIFDYRLKTDHANKFLHSIVLLYDLTQNTVYDLEIFTKEGVKDFQIILLANFSSFVHWPGSTQATFGIVIYRMFYSQSLLVKNRCNFYTNLLKKKYM